MAPEDKVRLVDILKRKGHVVAMTGDGVNDAPALKRADIGVAMGITGTEVSKEAAVMILTDDNFATIVKAVELGRGLYDNLVKYIRFQMAGLFGFIVTFLGASIFYIADGIPFLPLQTLWVNFTIDALPGRRPGLRQGARRTDGRDTAVAEPPHPASPPHDLARLRRPRHGCLHAGCHLVGDRRLRRRDGPHDGPDRLLAGQHLVRARDVDPTRSLFSGSLADNPTLLKGAGLALLATIAATELGSSTGSSTPRTWMLTSGSSRSWSPWSCSSFPRVPSS